MQRRRKSILIIVIAAVGLAACLWAALHARRRSTPTPAPVAEAMALRQYDRAVELLTDELRAHPSNPGLLMTRADCKLKMGDAKAAREDFTLALAADPSELRGQVGLARVLAAEGKLADALEAAGQAKSTHPDRGEPDVAIGEIEFELFRQSVTKCFALIEQNAKGASGADAGSAMWKGQFELVQKLASGAAPWQADLKREAAAAQEHYQAVLDGLKAGVGKMKDEAPPEPLMLLASMDLSRGDIDAAEPTARRAAAIPRADIVEVAALLSDVLTAKADARLSAGRKEEAHRLRRETVDMLERAVAKQGAAALYERLGRQYAALGKSPEADESFHAAMAGSYSPNPHYVRGAICLMNGDFVAALAELLQANDDMGQDVQYHYYLWLAYYRNGSSAASVGQAITELVKVTQLRPMFVHARIQLAKLELANAMYAEALKQAEHVFAVETPEQRTCRLYMILAEANHGLRRFDQALYWLEKAGAKASSDDQFVWEAQHVRDALDSATGVGATDDAVEAYIRGYIYLSKGKLERAADSLRRAILLNSDMFGAQVCLAKTLEEMGKVPDAIAQYNALITELEQKRGLSENASLRYGLALLYVKQVQYPEAREQLERVLRIDPSHGPARLWLAELDMEGRKFGSALSWMKSALDACDAPVGIRFLEGLVYSTAARRSESEMAGLFTGETSGAADETTELVHRSILWQRAVEQYEKTAAENASLRFPEEQVRVAAVLQRFDAMAAACDEELARTAGAGRAAVLRQKAIALMGLARITDAAQTAAASVDAASKEKDPSELLRCRLLLVCCHLANRDFPAADAAAQRIESADLKADVSEMAYRIGQQTAGTPKMNDLPIVVGRDLCLGVFLAGEGPEWLPFAEQAYRRVLARDGANVAALRQLSDLYLLTKQYDKADEVNRRTLELSPKGSRPLRNLAVVEEARVAAAESGGERKIENHAKAIDLYRRSIQADPARWLPQIELAAIYEQFEKTDEAAKLLESAARMKPSIPVVLDDYAKLGERQSDGWKRAFAAAETGSDLGLYREAAIKMAAEIRRMLDGPNARVRLIGEGRLLLVDQPEMRYRLAKAYAKIGDKSAAVGLLNEVLADETDFPGRTDAKALLGELKSK